MFVRNPLYHSCRFLISHGCTFDALGMLRAYLGGILMLPVSFPSTLLMHSLAYQATGANLGLVMHSDGGLELMHCL